MGNLEKERIRESVRDTYGKVAMAGVSGPAVNGPGVNGLGASRSTSCCGPADKSVETIPVSSCGCGDPGFSARQMSTTMGYSKEDIDNVPEGANMGLGCGNPVALASLKPGETVVDLGSGGGFDCFLAAREVGNTGRVIRELGSDHTICLISIAFRPKYSRF